MISRSCGRSCAKAADPYPDEPLRNEGADRMSIVIVGAGPNLGAAVARRFGREGLPVGLISRDAAKLERLAAELEVDGLQVAFRAADIRDAGALSATIAALADELGPV